MEIVAADEDDFLGGSESLVSAVEASSTDPSWANKTSRRSCWSVSGWREDRRASLKSVDSVSESSGVARVGVLSCSWVVVAWVATWSGRESFLFLREMKASISLTNLGVSGGLY